MKTKLLKKLRKKYSKFYVISYDCYHNRYEIRKYYYDVYGDLTWCYDGTTYQKLIHAQNKVREFVRCEICRYIEDKTTNKYNKYLY